MIENTLTILFLLFSGEFGDKHLTSIEAYNYLFKRGMSLF